ELVHAGETAKDDAIADMHMTGDRGVVGEDAVIANDAIVGNMHIGHEKIIAADARQAVVLHGATMQGGTFANDIVVTNFQPRRLALVLLVLALLAHRGKLENTVALADTRRTTHYHVRTDHGAGTDFHIRADNGKRADFHISGQLGFRVNNRARMYHRLCTLYQASCCCSATIKSAEATNLPSTCASPVNLRIL